MDEDDLPSDFDVIVIGTGMTESIVAAAASRVGKKVLHFDSDDFYGGMWASFNFESLLKIAQDGGTSEAPNEIGLFNIEHQWLIKTEIPEIKNIPSVEESPGDNSSNQESEDSSNSVEPLPAEAKEVIDSETKPQKMKWSQDSLRKEYRKFNLDLAPKLLFARGELVQLLISSNIARYTEFRCVNRVLTWINNELEPVPCSRADVFATKHVSVVEKRMLMKLLSSLMEYDESKSAEFHDVEHKTFLEYLKSKKLTSNLIHYVLYAIAGGTDSMPCVNGIQNCKKFLTSLGRYGNTPFLWSMYGCGELPQCFCRLCAVYGGVYCLKRPLDSIEIVEGTDSVRSIKVNSQGKTLNCDHIISGVNKIPKEFLTKTNFPNGISRGIFIINESILEFEKEPLTLLQFPPLSGKKNPVTIIELGPATYSCPKGLYIVHMTCKQSGTAKEDLQEYAEKLLNFDDSDLGLSGPSVENKKRVKPQVLWCMYFNMKDTSEDVIDISTSPRIHICSGPDIALDFDHAVQEGHKIFSAIYPDCEFLPRAPDPEELVFDGDDSQTGPIFEKDINNTESNETASVPATHVISDNKDNTIDAKEENKNDDVHIDPPEIVIDNNEENENNDVHISPPENIPNLP